MQDSLQATMSIAFLQPVFDALLRCASEKEELAAQLNLNKDKLYRPEIFIPANSVYKFLGWATEIAGDPLFSARIGQSMAADGWAPVMPLMASSLTVGDFFQKFGQLASKQGRSVIYRLEVEGPVAVWRMTRPAGASADARFADAIAVGFFVQILKMAAKNEWDEVQIVAVLADTSLVPRDLLPSTSVISGQIGLSLRFPSDLLGLEMPSIVPPDDLPKMDLPDKLDDALDERVRQLVERRISETNLDVVSIAKGIGLSKWKLQSSLSAMGTSVSEIREDVRRTLAIERVVASSEPIGSIATTLGYTDGSNFTRAFRGWTGKTPREVRRNP